jgi:hypothetical protein
VMTGWTTSISSGQWITVDVTSASSITLATLSIKGRII